MKCAPCLPGCGTRHPHRALGGTRVLLAAAPTTPPCFRRWRRSSLLQRKNYFYFRASGASADAPLALFHRWGLERTPSVKAYGFASSLGEGVSGVSTNFVLQPETVPSCQRPHLRGGCRRRRLGEFPRERLRGRIFLLFVPNSTFWGENRKRLSKVHKKAAQSLAGTGLTVSGRNILRNRTTN